jgi:hypothetical protein
MRLYWWAGLLLLVNTSVWAQSDAQGPSIDKKYYNTMRMVGDRVVRLKPIDGPARPNKGKYSIDTPELQSVRTVLPKLAR